MGRHICGGCNAGDEHACDSRDRGGGHIDCSEIAHDCVLHATITGTCSKIASTWRTVPCVTVADSATQTRSNFRDFVASMRGIRHVDFEARCGSDRD
jgi:hypothetical protein